MIMFVMFIAVLAVLFIGVSTACSMALVSVGAYFSLGEATMSNMMSLPQGMFNQVSGITLMSIPFFLLMGNFMNAGGISQDLFGFARACLGHRWGGLANAAIVSCMVMSAMSGSAAAVAAGIGMIAISEMRKTGYEQSFYCATIAASGGLGPIIPPSITMILFASMISDPKVGVSVNDLFMGGAIPGVLIGIMFITYASFACKKRNFGKVSPVPMKERLRYFGKAIWALFTPVIVLGGMFGGLFTATEAAAVAALYAALLGIFKYRKIKLKDFPHIFWITAKSSAQIMFVIATASFFQYVLLRTRIPQQAVNAIVSVFGSIVPVLLIIILMLVIMGCFMEGTAILMITVPIFVPLAQAYNYSIIQLAVVMCISLSVGVITPPVGLNLYVLSSITGEKVMRIAKEAVPFVLIMITVALLAAFISPLSLFLPSLGSV